MSTRAERKARARDDTRWGRLKRGVCPECGEKGPHYIPASFGDPGFFTCARKYPS